MFRNKTQQKNIPPHSIPDPPRHFDLQVNGQWKTRVAFPATGSKRAGHIWIQLLLQTNSSGNDLIFSTDRGPEPVIGSISVQ